MKLRRVQQHLRQILGDGSPVALGHRLELGHRYKAHGHVQGVEGFLFAQAGIGGGLPHAQALAGVAVAGIGILLLGRIGRGSHVQHAPLVGDVVPAQPQIHRQQGAEEGQCAGAVRQGVEHLHGDAPLVVEKADQPILALAKAYRLAGVGDVRLNEGAGSMIGLEIIPEHPLLDAHRKAGKAGQGGVHRLLQQHRVHRLAHQGRKPVDGGIVLPLQGGIHQGGVVQPGPAAGKGRHGIHLRRIGLFFLILPRFGQSGGKILRMSIKS